MAVDFAFSDLLAEYLADAGVTTGRLSRLSTVPRKTIQHWISGHVVRPSSPVDLLRLAAALRLTVLQTDALLHAAGHLALADLARLSGDPHVRSLLACWHDALAHTTTPPPFQAIADLPTLVGRDEEIKTLARVLRGHDYPGICCLSGMGGVGKTVLAAHLAYRLRPHFPDGVLWARVDVTPPLAILGAFAQAFDYDVHHTSDLYARSQIVRTLLAHKRVLIIFDNVRQRDELEPLLPPSGSCRVLVTTRQHDLLSGTIGYHLEMTPFVSTDGHAQALFAQILGSERATREQAALAEIAELVGYLPLALAIVASRLAHAPAWSAADAALRLRDVEGRLTHLEHDCRSVRATLALSYAHLTPIQQRCLMALAVCASAEADVTTIAIIADISTIIVVDTIQAVLALSLAHHVRHDRFRIHPLVKAYVLEQPIDPAIWQSMVTSFLAFLDQYKYHYVTLDGEIDNLMGAFAATLRWGMEAQFVRGVIHVSPYLRDRGHYAQVAAYLTHAASIAHMLGQIDNYLTIILEQGQLAEQSSDIQQAEEVWRGGLACAREHQDAAWIATLLLPLGEILGRTGDLTARELCWQEALVQIDFLTDRRRASELLRQLGLHTAHGGDFKQAVSYWRRALDLAHAANAPVQTCRILAHLSAVLCQMGEWDAAATYAHDGIRHAQEQHLDWIAAQLLGDLSIIARQCHDFVPAQVYLNEGIHLARTSGYRFLLSDLLIRQGILARLRGAYTQAEEAFNEAQEISNRLRLAWLGCELSYEWGELYLARQQWAEAAAAFARAWEIAQARHMHFYLAPIAYGHARLAHAQQRYDDARRWGEESLQRHQTLNHRQTSEVAVWLALLVDNPVMETL